MEKRKRYKVVIPQHVWDQIVNAPESVKKEIEKLVKGFRDGSIDPLTAGEQIGSIGKDGFSAYLAPDVILAFLMGSNVLCPMMERAAIGEVVIKLSDYALYEALAAYPSRNEDPAITPARLHMLADLIAVSEMVDSKNLWEWKSKPMRHERRMHLIQVAKEAMEMEQRCEDEGKFDAGPQARYGATEEQVKRWLEDHGPARTP